MNETDYYAILKISPNESRLGICEAYRKLSLDLHPDLEQNKGNRSKLTAFNLINEAFEVLYDDKKRAIYDVHGYQGLHYGVDDKFGGYCYLGNGREIFEEFFGTSNIYTAVLETKEDLTPILRKHKCKQRPPPETLSIEVDIDLETVMIGGNLIVKYKKNKITSDFMGVFEVDLCKYINFEQGTDPNLKMIFEEEGHEAPGYRPCKCFVVSINSQLIWKLISKSNHIPGS
jgi:DnaJ-class molecular chaperone